MRQFPLGKTGGLIEADYVRNASCSRRWVFPLGKTGGLIEAGHEPDRSRDLRGFRWVKPAASLKLLDPYTHGPLASQVSAG